jgi:hypothetical protein
MDKSIRWRARILKIIVEFPRGGVYKNLPVKWRAGLDPKKKI